MADKHLPTHFVRYNHWYLPLLVFLLLNIPVVMNLFQEKPLIMGGESYYHLLQAPQRVYAFPLLLEHWLGEGIIFFLPLLGALSAWLFLKLGARFGLAPSFLTLFAVLFFSSPPFLYAFSILSFYGYYFILLLTGFLLLSSRRSRYLALAPFMLAALYDVVHAVLAVILVAIYCHKNPVSRKEGIILGAFMVATAVAGTWLGQDLALAGPFHEPDIPADLISDVGVAPGVSLFLSLLALLGIILSWPKRAVLLNMIKMRETISLKPRPLLASGNFFYIMLGMALVMYLLRTESLFWGGLILAFFASLALQQLARRRWQLQNLKQFTILLLILGLIFSTLSFLERSTEPGPTAADMEASSWIKQNLPRGVIFSSLEQAYFLKYATGFPVPEYYHQRGNITAAILDKEYVRDLFPLLENQNITLIYVSPGLREKLPPDHGFLFLLKNERFKLVHSNKEAEVWVFNGN